MPIPRKTKLTFKKKMFARKVVETMKPTQSALAVYDTKSTETARKIAYTNMHDPLVNEEIERLLTNHGLGADDVVGYAKRIIDTSIDVKPNQKNAVTLITTLLKHNQIGQQNKSAHLRVNLTGKIPDKNLDEMIKAVSAMTATTSQLAKELQGKK